MNELESFLDECRADPWFRDRPELPDRIEEVLTKFYRASDDNPEWQAIWDRVCEILEQKNEALPNSRVTSRQIDFWPISEPV